MTGVTVDVPGIPVPQGSKRAYRGVIVDTNHSRLRPWRALVTAAVAEALPGTWDNAPAMRVAIVFLMPRPKRHYRADGRTLKPAAPDIHSTRPDLDKLVRAVLDACTDAGAWRDDCQVARLDADKRYPRTRPGCRISIEPLEDRP